MTTVQNWDSCCNEAIQQSKRMGIMSAMNSRTIRNWYQDFRVKRKFKMICLYSKHNLPPFLQQNKDICQSMQQYGREHLHELSMELMCEYLHATILPKMVKEESGVVRENDKEHGEYDNELRKILGTYGLTCICPSTIYRWMNILGFKYEQRKKGYYVDGHEKPATVEYRKLFVKCYLAQEHQVFW